MAPVPPVAPAGVVLPVLGPVLPIHRPVAAAPTAARRPFLMSVRGPRGFGNIADWTAVKVLGRGASGIVVLWEYTGPLANRPSIHKKIVVKTALNHRRDELLNEGDIMDILGTSSRSEHVVRLAMYPPLKLTAAQCAAEGLDPVNWLGITRRLIMEYCSQASLGALLRMRQAR